MAAGSSDSCCQRTESGSPSNSFKRKSWINETARILLVLFSAMMRRTAILVLALFALLAIASARSPRNQPSFDDFIRDHGRAYSDAEYAQRKLIYEVQKNCLTLIPECASKRQMPAVWSI